MKKITSEEVEQIQELIGLFTSGQKGKINWFYRKMYNKPEPFKNEVWSLLKAKGIPVEQAIQRVLQGPGRNAKPSLEKYTTERVQRRGRVDWMGAEWDRLADLIESMRRNNPEPPLSLLIKNAQAQFPQDRRRQLKGSEAKEPLLKRIRERYQSLATAKSDLEKLIQKVAEQEQAPTKEEILASLTDDEIVQNFSQNVLDSFSPAEIFARFPTEALLESIPNSMLIAHAIQKIVESIGEVSTNFNRAFGDLGPALQSLIRKDNKQVTPSIPLPRPVFGRKPRVTVVGMIGDQSVQLESKLAGRADFNFVDKDQKIKVPNSADIVVFWASVCSHKTRDQIRSTLPNSCQVITHYGGIKKMVETLDTVLPKC